jgi:alpha-ketoglutarate-dependent 2,4-dichlorophenoxyacetate dioxygenase
MGVMTLSIQQITPAFAGEVSGVDITRRLAHDDVAAIEAGMDRYAVLVFRDQHLTDDAQRAFTRNFGTLEASPGGHVATEAERRLPLDMQDASNLDKDQKPLARDDRRRMFNLGNRLWHSDSSYRAVPAKYSLLSGRVVVERGGHTEFADMRAAYDALPEATQQAIDGLVVEHDVFWSRGQIGFTEFPPGEREQYPPSPQRLVRVHPGSHRKTLYLSAHASHIVGWPVADGRLLLWDLTAHATQQQFVYSHTWRVGDLVIWDNRVTMHRGRPHDEAQPRDLRRATTLDTASTLEQVA